MFWSSVFGGFGALAHWQVLVGSAIYLLVVFGTLALPTLSAHYADRNVDPGFFSGQIYLGLIRPFICGITLGVVVAWMLPALLQTPGYASEWPNALLAGAIVGAVSTLPVLLLSFSPFGDIINAGIQTYFQGIFVVATIAEKPWRHYGYPSSALPDIWHALGFFAISFVLTYLVLALFIVARKEQWSRGASFDIGSLAGLLPLFMYTIEFAANAHRAAS